MKITREADYALRIIAMLADENRQIEAKAIAEKNDIPYRFTLKILRKIVQAGIIKSYRGAELYDYDKFLYQEGNQGFDVGTEHFLSLIHISCRPGESWLPRIGCPSHCIHFPALEN